MPQVRPVKGILAVGLKHLPGEGKDRSIRGAVVAIVTRWPITRRAAVASSEAVTNNKRGNLVDMRLFLFRVIEDVDQATTYAQVVLLLSVPSSRGRVYLKNSFNRRKLRYAEKSLSICLTTDMRL